MKWPLALLLAAGCATGGTDHHAIAMRRVASQPYALEPIALDGPRPGQLSSARELWRLDTQRATARSDASALSASFARDLSQKVPLEPDAPLRLRTTLTLQDTAAYEGLAAESTDVTLSAD